MQARGMFFFLCSMKKKTMATWTCEEKVDALYGRFGKSAIPKIAIEEHIILPSQLKHVHWPSPVLKQRQADLLEYETKRPSVMRQANIKISILSAFSDGVQALPPCLLSKSSAKKWNDELYAIAKTNPRFKCFAALPMCDARDAADEMRRCCETMGFCGALINGRDTSSENEESYSNRYVDPAYDELWKTAVELDLPIYIHPRMADSTPFFDETPNCAMLRGSPWGFHSSTARLVMALIFNGVCDRHPKIKFILGHMGEIIVWMAWRIDHRYKMEGRKSNVLATLKRNFYATVSGWMDNTAFTHVQSIMGSERIMYASDYPMEDTVEHAKWFDALPIDDADKRLIAYENAMRLFKIDFPKIKKKTKRTAAHVDSDGRVRL
jgi:predicted TIM-barrel fold metal-dependent hydrolase